MAFTLVENQAKREAIEVALIAATRSGGPGDDPRAIPARRLLAAAGQFGRHTSWQSALWAFQDAQGRAGVRLSVNERFVVRVLNEVDSGHRSVRNAAALLGMTVDDVQVMVWGEVRL